MQIEIGLPDSRSRGVLVVVTAVLLMVGLGFLGWVVTPWAAGQPLLLTPVQWQAAALARAAATETRELQKDAAELSALLSARPPDPVNAMLLAQRIYAAHHTGTSATGPARQALIAAASTAAAYAAGSATQNEAAAAFAEALSFLDVLTATANDEDGQTADER